MTRLRPLTRRTRSPSTSRALDDEVRGGARASTSSSTPRLRPREPHRSATDAFPDGEAAPGNWLFAVEDGEGTRVGVLWLGDPFDGEPDTLWVYDIEIDPDHRGRGLGRDAMLLAEAEARRLGRQRIKLNVFARNAVARALYLSLGFEEMSIQMSKPVGEDQA